MNKKLLISLCLVGGLLFLGGSIAYANSYEELKKALETYLADPSLDWLGRNYDKILFEHARNKSLDGELWAKINFIFDDLLTMPQQLKCLYKITSQKPNALAYSSLGGLAGLKAGLGAKEFNKVALKILKLVIK